MFGKCTVRYFCHSFIHRGTTFMYLQYSRPPYLSHFAKCLESVQFNISDMALFTGVQHLCSMTAAVWLLTLSWRMMEFCSHHFLLSLCDYDLFAKVKEPLWGTRYNTRVEPICAIGCSIWNINKEGHADGVRRLPNIWQKVINKSGDYTDVTCMLYPCELSHFRNIKLLPLLFIQSLHIGSSELEQDLDIRRLRKEMYVVLCEVFIHLTVQCIMCSWGHTISTMGTRQIACRYGVRASPSSC